MSVSERIESYRTFCVLVSKTALSAPWQRIKAQWEATKDKERIGRRRANEQWESKKVGEGQKETGSLTWEGGED